MISKNCVRHIFLGSVVGVSLLTNLYAFGPYNLDTADGFEKAFNHVEGLNASQSEAIRKFKAIFNHPGNIEFAHFVSLISHKADVPAIVNHYNGLYKNNMLTGAKAKDIIDLLAQLDELAKENPSPQLLQKVLNFIEKCNIVKKPS